MLETVSYENIEDTTDHVPDGPIGFGCNEAATAVYGIVDVSCGRPSGCNNARLCEHFNICVYDPLDKPMPNS